MNSATLCLCKRTSYWNGDFQKMDHWHRPIKYQHWMQCLNFFEAAATDTTLTTNELKKILNMKYVNQQMHLPDFHFS